MGSYDKLATVTDVKKLYNDLVNSANKVFIIFKIRLLLSYLLDMQHLFGAKMLLILKKLLKLLKIMSKKYYNMMNLNDSIYIYMYTKAYYVC